MAESHHVRMFRQQCPHDLPLNPDPFAVNYPDRQNIPLETDLDIIQHRVARLIRTELVQVECAVDRIFNWVVAVRLHTNKIAREISTAKSIGAGLASPRIIM